jgi:hypothetical protein
MNKLKRDSKTTALLVIDLQHGIVGLQTQRTRHSPSWKKQLAQRGQCTVSDELYEILMAAPHTLIAMTAPKLQCDSGQWHRAPCDAAMRGTFSKRWFREASCGSPDRTCRPQAPKRGTARMAPGSAGLPLTDDR